MPLRCGQRHTLGLSLLLVERFVQASVLRAGNDKTLPAANDQIDWSQRAPQQHGPGKHHTCTNLMVHREVGPQSEDQRLHQEPERLGKRADYRGSIACQGLEQQDDFLPSPPTLHEGVEHAHGLDDFGVAQVFRSTER